MFKNLKLILASLILLPLSLQAQSDKIPGTWKVDIDAMKPVIEEAFSSVRQGASEADMKAAVDMVVRTMETTKMTIHTNGTFTSFSLDILSQEPIEETGKWRLEDGLFYTSTEEGGEEVGKVQELTSERLVVLYEEQTEGQTFDKIVLYKVD